MGMSKCMWLEFLGFPNYVLNQAGLIYNFNNTNITNIKDGRIRFQLALDGKIGGSTVNSLMTKCFGIEIDEVPEEDKKNLSFLGFLDYTVTRAGRIWSHLSNSWLNPTIDNYSYYKVTLIQPDKHRVNFQVHRLVALAFIPNPENKPEVNHKDGDKLNNNDWNLEWNTRLENVRHYITYGLQRPVEEYVPLWTVHEICLLLEQEERICDIAKLLIVPYDTVAAIKYRKNHKHIGKEYKF